MNFISQKTREKKETYSKVFPLFHFMTFIVILFLYQNKYSFDQMYF